MLEYARGEHGAEMVEWVVVVVILTVVASVVFGPDGVLSNALVAGLNKIPTFINSLPASS
jgi:hypothetical protein